MITEQIREMFPCRHDVQTPIASGSIHAKGGGCCGGHSVVVNVANLWECPETEEHKYDFDQYELGSKDMKRLQ